MGRMEESVADIDQRVRKLDKQVAVLTSQRETTDGLVKGLANHVQELSTSLHAAVEAIRAQLTGHIVDEARRQRTMMWMIIVTLAGVIWDLVINYIQSGGQ